MLNQLEFVCPNQSHGCNMILKYEQLDTHFQSLCDAIKTECPNRCTQPPPRFSAKELQKHLNEDCPKECVKCSQCKKFVFRCEMQNHLMNECEKTSRRNDVSMDQASTSTATTQVTNQLATIKTDLSSMQNLITTDVFQMIDNLSQALTEKESEVEGVKRRLHTDIRDQQENQKNME